jgi:hypothetical protein
MVLEVQPVIFTGFNRLRRFVYVGMDDHSLCVLSGFAFAGSGGFLREISQMLIVTRGYKMGDGYRVYSLLR